MRAGALRSRLAFDEPVVTQDTSGSEVVAMTERFVIWASLDAATGREAVNANQLLPTVDTKIAIRWSLASAAVTAKWQAQEVDRTGVRFGPVFDIQSANDASRRREQIDILARSGALAS